jgi:outer membrane protein assembly factor BamB/tRNA A-37 threonylcarbamoyl transferase component Bud32
MGSVYQARDLRFPNVTRYVAVKEMLNLSTDQNLRDMTLRTFERESDMLASLSHPAVPKIYEYFPSKTRAYLVMEYINGRDLEMILNSAVDFLPADTVLKWAQDLCDVLGYLHAQKPEPIIFRDVKPSNIMVDQHGQIRLVDFGIAKIFQEGLKGTMIGTEGYSAPEQYRGEASPASDVYGIGATLHHLLTRRDPRLEPPFTFHERAIAKVNPAVRPEFEAVVMKALEFKPEDRFADAAAMKAALEGIGRPVLTPLSVGAPALAEEGADWTDAGVKPLWVFECEDEVRSSPVVHRGVLYVGAHDNNLYAVTINDGAFRWKYPSEQRVVSTPAVADAENLVLFGSVDHLLYAVDTRVGQLQWTARTQGPVLSSPSVAHGHVFFGSDDGHLYAVRLSTGRIQWKFAAGAAVRSRPLVTGNLIVIGLESGEVVGTDLSGRMVWGFRAKRSVSSSPLEHEGMVIFGSMDWQVYALDLEHGWKVWEFRTGKPVVSSPTYGDGKIFVGSVDGSLYAIEAASGKERWRFETQGQITSSPAYAEGAVYFGGVDGHVYSVEAKTGRLRWSLKTGAPVPGSPIVQDGVVYIGSMDHKIYALKA